MEPRKFSLSQALPWPLEGAKRALLFLSTGFTRVVSCLLTTLAQGAGFPGPSQGSGLWGPPWGDRSRFPLHLPLFWWGRSPYMGPQGSLPWASKPPAVQRAGAQVRPALGFGHEPPPPSIPAWGGDAVASVLWGSGLSV